MAISSPGPVCVPGTTRAPASGDPIACARAHPGSRPPSSNAPGPPPVIRPATFRPVPSAPRAARRKKGYRSRRRLNPHRHLSHAHKRNPVPGSRGRSLRPPGQNRPNQTARRKAPEPWLRRPNHTARSMTETLFLSSLLESPSPRHPGFTRLSGWREAALTHLSPRRANICTHLCE